MQQEVDIEELELELDVESGVVGFQALNDETIGRYQLLKPLGSGGMATVYLGQGPKGGLAAIKLFHPQDPDPQALARFRREYMALSRLSHPNIVGVKDAGLHHNQPFFAMEFVEGHDLGKEREILADLPPEERYERIIGLFTQLCRALDYIHGSGLVHRDLKPSNILINEDQVAKVTDFGIARDLLSNLKLTAPGSFLGTVTHIAPEQIQGQAVDHRADLYSLGVLLYELLCQRRPFKAADTVGYAYLHVHRAPTPPRSIDPDIPSALEAVALKLLLKNPADRFQSGEAAIAALRGREARELKPPSREPEQVPWVGREVEIHNLFESLKAPAESPGAMMIVQGSWGVGKSRLVREVLLRLPLEGLGTIEGRCTSPDVLYGGFQGVISAMAREVRDGDDRPGRQILAKAETALGWAFPDLGSGTTEGVIEPRLERYRVATAVMELIVWLAVRRPRVIFLDDIHLADRATRELVTYIAVQLHQRRIPVNFVVTMEPADAPPLPLLSPENNHLVSFLSLQPLPPESVGKLARLLMGRGALNPVEEIARGAQGRPSFLIELVDAWRQGLDKNDDHLVQTLPPIPPRVREAVLYSLHDVHMPGVEILVLLAALGREATTSFLRQVLVIRDDVLKGRIRRLEEEGWLEARHWDGAEQWDLPSWVSRAVLYESLSEASRLDLHERLARALSRKRDLSPDALASLAQQLHLGGQYDDAWPRHLAAASVLLESRSSRAALHHINSAEEIADRLTVGDRAMALREDRAKLLRLKGEALFAIGQTRPGLDALRASLRLSERLGTADVVARARQAVGTSLLALGHHKEAERALRSAAKAWQEAADALGFGTSLVIHGELNYAVGRPGRSEEPLREAITLAERHGDRALLAHALLAQGMVAFGRGNGVAALDSFDASEGEFRAIQARPGLSRCLATRTEVAWWLGELATVYRGIEEATRVAKETELRMSLAQARLVSGFLDQELGRWDDAAATFEEVVSLTSRPGYSELTAAARVGRAWVALGRGDPGSALDWLRLPRKRSKGGWCQTLLACKAWALAALGQIEEAQETIRSIEDSPGPLAPRVILRVAMGWAALMMGNVDEARHLAFHALKRADRMGLKPTALHAHLLLQAAAFQVGDRGLARQIRGDIDALVIQLSAGLPPEEAHGLRTRPDLRLPEEAAA